MSSLDSLIGLMIIGLTVAFMVVFALQERRSPIAIAAYCGHGTSGYGQLGCLWKMDAASMFASDGDNFLDSHTAALFGSEYGCIKGSIETFSRQ